MSRHRKDKFWATLTHKRDTGLAHLTDLIHRNGIEEFCAFLSKHVMPKAMDEHADHSTVEYLVAHCAIVGAVDALLAYRDAQEDGDTEAKGTA